MRLKINGTEISKISFGGTDPEKDDLAGKVINGQKTATSSLEEYYFLGLKKRSKVGDYFSVLDSSGKEVALVRIEKIGNIQFGNVTEKFAVEEGDGSLENWKSIHQPYYSELLQKIGKELNDETILVCEWFKVMRTYLTNS